MYQPSIIYISRANGFRDIIQNGDITTINISDQITLTFNFRNDDKLYLNIKDIGEKFIISTKEKLEEFYNMYTKNQNTIQSIYEWCNENLTKEEF